MHQYECRHGLSYTTIRGGTIYHKTEYRERRNHLAFYHSSRLPNGYDTDRDAFFGIYNGIQNPQTVKEATPRNSTADGWAPVASHCHHLTLTPGETTQLVFILGYVENLQDDKWVGPGRTVHHNGPQSKRCDEMAMTAIRHTKA